MIFKTALILIAFVFAFATINELRKANIWANDKPDAMVALSNSPGSQSPATLSKDSYSSASVRVEPLLLLLLGSTLFAIGTAIKMFLSRKLNSKPIAAVTTKPRTTQF